MSPLNLAPALRSALARDPGSVPAVLAELGRQLGGSDLVVYLIDFGQLVLEPLKDDAPHAELPGREEVAGTMAGRAFLSQRPVTAARDGGFRVWVPVIEGSDHTGVLAVTMADTEPETLIACEELGLFAGYLIATHARVTDVFNLHRRRKSMTLAASMQWDLLPPLVFKSPRVTVAAFLEPAYEVGGDCFDYAINGAVLDTAVMDAMGHGINSAILAGLAAGCYRQDRREGRPLDVIHRDLDSAIAHHYPANGFVTGQLGQLNVETGDFVWTNAGHPLPLLIRRGTVIGQLDCKPTPPWGVGRDGVPADVAVENLEPDDRILFFSDGAVDGRNATGSGFGLDRLVDLAGRAASDQTPPETIVRDLAQAVVHHHGQTLGDDVTLMMIQWHGPRPARV